MLWTVSPAGVLIPDQHRATSLYHPGMGPPGECQLCHDVIDATDDYLVHSPNAPKVPDGFRRFPAHVLCWSAVIANFGTATHYYAEHPYRGW